MGGYNQDVVYSKSSNFMSHQNESYCTITLTQGKETIIDYADLGLVEGYAWYAYRGKNRDAWYACATYKDNNGVHKHIKMHRLIMGVTDPDIKIDHENHNGLDNTRRNLRLATYSQNNANIGKRGDNKTSKYLGVYSNYTRKDGSKSWRFLLEKDGVKYFGTAISEWDAARAYNRLAVQHHGEFAVLNKILCK